MQNFGKKAKERLSRLRYVGFFSAKEAEEKEMRLVTGREGDLCLYWLVDEADGVIADAKFQAFGPPLLLLAAELACELVLRKNYDQALRLSAELFERQIPFPAEGAAFLNQALMAIDKAVHQCIDIPYARTDYDVTPIAWDQEEGGGVADWEKRSLEERLQIVKELIAKEVQPYIELDAGGVLVKELKENGELLIAYEGACTTCHSSTGSTLSAIQQIVKSRVHPTLFVTPVDLH